MKYYLKTILLIVFIGTLITSCKEPKQNDNKFTKKDYILFLNDLGQIYKNELRLQEQLLKANPETSKLSLSQEQKEKISEKYTTVAKTVILHSDLLDKDQISSRCWSCFWSCWAARDFEGDDYTFTAGCYDKYIATASS